MCFMRSEPTTIMILHPAIRVMLGPKYSSRWTTHAFCQRASFAAVEDLGEVVGTTQEPI